jgi:Zn-finger nucleic acid-binding protein
MRIIAHCPKCDAGLPVSAADAPESIRCGRCAHELSLSFSEAVRTDARVDTCPVCRGRDFYIRKDFDPKVGLTVVIIGALISAVFYWFGEDLIAYSILGGAALVDLFV